MNNPHRSHTSHSPQSQLLSSQLLVNPSSIRRSSSQPKSSSQSHKHAPHKTPHMPTQLLVVISLSTLFSWMSRLIPDNLWMIALIIDATDIAIMIGIAAMSTGRCASNMYILYMGLLYKYIAIVSSSGRYTYDMIIGQQNVWHKYQNVLHDNIVLQVVYAYMLYTAYCYSVNYTSISGYGYIVSILGSVAVIVGHCYWYQCYGRQCGVLTVLGGCVGEHVLVYIYCVIAYVYRIIYHQHKHLRWWGNSSANGIYKYHPNQHQHQHQDEHIHQPLQTVISNRLSQILHTSAMSHPDTHHSSHSHTPPIHHHSLVWLSLSLGYTYMAVTPGCLTYWPCLCMGVLAIVYGSGNIHSVKYIKNRYTNVLVCWILLYIGHVLYIYIFMYRLYQQWYQFDSTSTQNTNHRYAYTQYILNYHLCIMCVTAIQYMYICIQPLLLQHRAHVLSTSTLAKITMLLPNQPQYEQAHNSTTYISNDNIYNISVICVRLVLLAIIIAEACIAYVVSEQEREHGKREGGWMLGIVLLVCGSNVVALYRRYGVHRHDQRKEVGRNSMSEQLRHKFTYSQTFVTLMYRIIYITLTVMGVCHIYTIFIEAPSCTSTYSANSPTMVSAMLSIVAPCSSHSQYIWCLAHHIHGCTSYTSATSPTTIIHTLNLLCLCTLVLLAVLNMHQHRHFHNANINRYIKISCIIAYYSCITATYTTVLVSLYYWECTCVYNWLCYYLYILVLYIVGQTVPAINVLANHNHNNKNTPKYNNPHKYYNH